MSNFEKRPFHSNKHQSFVYTQLIDQTVLFQRIQFSIMSNSSIWPIDRTLSGATSPDRSQLDSDGNEGVLRISQNSCITGASPSDGLMSYPGHSLCVGGRSYLFAEMQLVYSTVLAVRTTYKAWKKDWRNWILQGQAFCAKPEKPFS